MHCRSKLRWQTAIPLAKTSPSIGPAIGPSFVQPHPPADPPPVSQSIVLGPPRNRHMDVSDMLGMVLQSQQNMQMQMLKLVDRLARGLMVWLLIESQHFIKCPIDVNCLSHPRHPPLFTQDYSSRRDLRNNMYVSICGELPILSHILFTSYRHASFSKLWKTLPLVARRSLTCPRSKRRSTQVGRTSHPIHNGRQ